MDKAVLKNFAIESRKDLMEKIDRKINLFYVDEDLKKDNRGDVIVLSNDKHSLTLTRDEDLNRDKLIKRIVEIGYKQVVEEAAYTWFNRIIAIRFMELHDFLPLGINGESINVRILSSKDNEPIPEILKFSNLSRRDLCINFSKDIYNSLKNDDEKFKYILSLVCKKIGDVIPLVFGGVTDYIDLLTPDNLLSEDGFVGKLIKEIDISNFEEVEIIGWLYQYYNQTEKDRVMGSKKNYDKTEIPYVTELFTPDWVVKYMVENSLGRFFVEHGASEEITNKWEFFIRDDINLINNNFLPTDVKFIDPCCGSGHILVYAFELLYDVYKFYGYNQKDIPALILKNNLYGLDIDDRAGQLSILSVLLKARFYDKNIFANRVCKELNILSIQESNNVPAYLRDYINGEIAIKIYDKLVSDLHDAKEFGSLLKIEKTDFTELLEQIKNDNTIFGIELREKIIPLIKTASILSNKYNVIVTNPPYLVYSSMDNKLKKYLDKHYDDSKKDLCIAFMEIDMVDEQGYYGMINQHSWMFISSYEKLRKKVIDNYNILNMLHLGTRAFEEIGGEVVQTTTFVFRKSNKNKATKFFRLVDFSDSNLKMQNAIKLIKNNDCYLVDCNIFKSIPSSIIAYWINEETIESFDKKKRVKDYVQSSVGIQTGDNDKFLHFWWEVDFNNIGFNIKSLDDTFNTKKWYPYNKGGEYRKWYGNDDLVIDWQNDGANIKRNSEVTHHHYQQYSDNLKFKRLVTWSRITSGTPSFRYKDFGYLSDMAGFSVFAEEKILKHLLAFCNSSVAKYYLGFLAPTLNIMVGSVNSMPYTYKENDEIDKLVNSNLNITKQDWDRFETSWNFKSHPLISSEKLSIEKMISVFAEKCNKDFDLLKNNEEKINSIFINDYGLSNSLSNIVDPKEVSVRKCNQIREIKSLISYAVGCMFGRYSLDEEGIIYAGGSFNKNIYKKITPDEDNIIPISESKNVYYNDDIVSRFVEFIKIAFGSENLNQNLEYIAVTLGKRGTETSEDTIRRYFVNDFYNDHIKIYQKRPIYWLFDSGRKNGFKCLIYVHRYDEQIVSKIRTKYLHNTISIYQRIIEDIDYKLNNEELNTSDKRELINNKNDINIKITECNNYEEMVGNVANKMIKLDLDDGVLVNYAKFVDDNGKSILAKIK